MRTDSTKGYDNFHSFRDAAGERGIAVPGNIEKERAAALKSEDQLRSAMRGADLVFIVAGLSGGTGTGASPVVARIAKESGALTIGVVTRPFVFEGIRRDYIAENSITEMRECVDTLLVIPTYRLIEGLDENATRYQALCLIDDALQRVVQSISDIINFTGMIVLDMDDLRSMMKDTGETLIGIGEATGPGRALRAVQEAIESPLLEHVAINNAKGLIVSIAGRKETLEIDEMKEIMATIQKESPDIHLKMGTVYNESLGDTIRVTLIAIGLPLRRRRGVK